MSTTPAPAGTAVTVREATREDMPLIHTMINELAAFEESPDGPRLSVADLEADGFPCSRGGLGSGGGGPAWFFALVAEVGVGEPVGYALANRAYSSWTGRSLYLEDLYVRPHARRIGVARALIGKLCQMGMEAGGVTRVDWHVLESNTAARALYAAIGARDMRLTEGRLALRLDEPAIGAAARAYAAAGAGGRQTRR